MRHDTIMQLSEQGLALIQESEGYSPAPYRCPAGKWTIGYGHVIRPGEDFSKGISREQALYLLCKDTEQAQRAVRWLVRVKLTQGQYDALVSLVYNIGEKAFERSTLLWHLNAGRKEKAAAQFKRWVYAGGKRLPGLVARREREAALFMQN